MTPAEFQQATGLTCAESAALLHVCLSKWYDWRSGKRPLPKYIRASMVAHALLHQHGLIHVRKAGT